jgi:hypothetical protein
LLMLLLLLLLRLFRSNFRRRSWIVLLLLLLLLGIEIMLSPLQNRSGMLLLLDKNCSVNNNVSVGVRVIHINDGATYRNNTLL